MKKLLFAVVVTAGTLSAQATLFQYTVSFSDAGEANPSTATGNGTVDYDSSAHTLTLYCAFSGLMGTTTASHIHAPTASPFTGNAGVATTTPYFVGFPIGVTSGTFNSVLDLTQSTSWNSAFITAYGGTTASAETAFAGFLAAGEAYWNIHTTYSPGGEIRGFLVPVPEPSSLALLGLGAAGMAARRWNRRRA